MTDNEIRAAWIWCREIWASYQIPETGTERSLRLQVWRETFRGIEAANVKAAVTHLSDREFMPSIGVIAAAARARQRDAQGFLYPPVRDQDDPLTAYDRFVMSKGNPPPPPGEHYMTPDQKRRVLAEMAGVQIGKTA